MSAYPPATGIRGGRKPRGGPGPDRSSCHAFPLHGRWQAEGVTEGCPGRRGWVCPRGHLPPSFGWSRSPSTTPLQDSLFTIPAKAGSQSRGDCKLLFWLPSWTPASAGVVYAPGRRTDFRRGILQGRVPGRGALWHVCSPWRGPTPTPPLKGRGSPWFNATSSQSRGGDYRSPWACLVAVAGKEGPIARWTSRGIFLRLASPKAVIETIPVQSSG